MRNKKIKDSYRDLTVLFTWNLEENLASSPSSCFVWIPTSHTVKIAAKIRRLFVINLEVFILIIYKEISILKALSHKSYEKVERKQSFLCKSNWMSVSLYFVFYRWTLQSLFFCLYFLNLKLKVGMTWSTLFTPLRGP